VAGLFQGGKFRVSGAQKVCQQLQPVCIDPISQKSFHIFHGDSFLSAILLSLSAYINSLPELLCRNPLKSGTVQLFLQFFRRQCPNAVENSLQGIDFSA
jgi:hypothetical protein